MCLVTLFSNAALGILSDLAKYLRLFHPIYTAVTSWSSALPLCSAKKSKLRKRKADYPPIEDASALNSSLPTYRVVLRTGRFSLFWVY